MPETFQARFSVSDLSPDRRKRAKTSGREGSPEAVTACRRCFK